LLVYFISLLTTLTCAFDVLQKQYEKQKRKQKQTKSNIKAIRNG